MLKIIDNRYVGGTPFINLIEVITRVPEITSKISKRICITEKSIARFVAA